MTIMKKMHIFINNNK